MMLQIKENIGDIYCDCDIIDSIALLEQGSGSGKSYFFKLLRDYLTIKNVPYLFVDYNNSQRAIDIIKSCKEERILLLDNFDIYATDDLVDWIRNSKMQYIISTHLAYKYKWGKANIYRINYAEDSIIIRKAGN